MNTTKKIIVIDLEATCWEEDTPAQRRKSEIIEIGVCILDSLSGEITKKKGILVQPEFSTISPFCTQLTTITPKMIEEEGILLDDACDILVREYNSEEFTWASYGNFDLNFLQEQCRKKRIYYPMTNNHINVKVALSRKLNMHKGMGMDKALKYLKIPMEGTHHRGVDDAYNTAKILHWCLQ